MAEMIASLPMYDWPEVREATDALGTAIATHLGQELELARTEDYTAAWRAPDLLFSQTCGYPFTHQYRGSLTYVATPHYGVDGCDGAHYSSIVLARRREPLEAFRGTVAAVNNPDSMSGMLALKLVFAPFASGGEFFSNANETGGHVASMIAVREGRADVCAIDAVCVALARRYRPDYLEGLHEIGRSPPVPSLPFVTRGFDAGAICSAISAVITDPAMAGARHSVFLDSISVLPPEAYDQIPELERRLEAAGGLSLL
jgi:ABC-type phosphate/phosphonate transport system substrate-binding protein